MERQQSKQRRNKSKMQTKSAAMHRRGRNAIIIAATVMLVVAGIAMAVSYNSGNTYNGLMQKADYMKGETERISNVNVEDTYNTSEDMNASQADISASNESNAGIAAYADGEKEKIEESKKIVENALTEQKEEQKSSYKKLDVKNILQYPELPTGCEITALTIVLNYLGYDVDKLTMADDYLDKGEVGSTSPYKAFVGNPRDENSCGAFAPVLARAASEYLDSQGSDMNVYNVTGADYSELVDYVNQGYPVMVWETMWMAKPHEADKWEVDGETITWLSHEHAMVLIGYVDDKYIMADPLRGIYEYDKDIVEARYEDMGKQAIVIY